MKSGALTHTTWWVGLVGALLVAAASSGSDWESDSCVEMERADVSSTGSDAETSPFGFPLESFGYVPGQADFQTSGRASSGVQYHAAEDYHAPAGTPVYAIADGEVSFSGTMGGYGWLVIVDHPEMNIYSLYGHLSPSRWNPDEGPVSMGDLIGYLGDEWENGGSHDEPLRAHLHLGVRSGQRTDYPGRGEWRWMAGWIDPCPTDLGWLRPSTLLTEQATPPDSFEGPRGVHLDWWLSEVLFAGLYAIAGIAWLVMAIRRQRPVLAAAVAVVFAGLGWYLTGRGFVLTGIPYVIAAAAGLSAIYMIARKANGTPQN